MMLVLHMFFVLISIIGKPTYFVFCCTSVSAKPVRVHTVLQCPVSLVVRR